MNQATRTTGLSCLHQSWAAAPSPTSNPTADAASALSSLRYVLGASQMESGRSYIRASYVMRYTSCSLASSAGTLRAAGASPPMVGL